LKELADERLASQHKSATSNVNENKQSIESAPIPEMSNIKSDSDKSTDVDDNNNDDDSDEEIELIPSMDDLYEIYRDRYAQLGEAVPELSSEVNDDEDDADDNDEVDEDFDYMSPALAQQLMSYLQEKGYGK
jgi:hypothetical protein